MVLSHTVCAHVGGPKNLGDAGPHPWDGGVADPLETRSPRVTMPNFVAVVDNHLGVRRIQRSRKLGTGPASLGYGGVADPRKTRYVFPYQISYCRSNRLGVRRRCQKFGDA